MAISGDKFTSDGTILKYIPSMGVSRAIFLVYSECASTTGFLAPEISLLQRHLYQPVAYQYF